MKQLTCKLLLGVTLMSGTFFTACKNKAKENESTESTTTVAPAQIDTTPTPPPITAAPDDALTTGVRDATKDYPGVTANVENGEITLSGEITRAKLTPMMQALNSLHAKKINRDNLKVK